MYAPDGAPFGSRRPAAPSEGRLSARHLILFSAPAFAIHAFGLPMIVYLPNFFCGPLGLDIAAVGLAFMVVRIADMFLDPIIGALLDRTRTPLGVYRPWLLASLPLLLMAIYGLFFAQPGITLPMLWLWLAVGFVGNSIIVLSHLSWASSLSTNESERTRIFAWWQIFASLGQLAMVAIPPMILSQRSGAMIEDMRAIGWSLAVILPVAVIGCVFATPRSRDFQTEFCKRVVFADYWKLVNRPDILRILLADLCLGLGAGTASATALFFHTRALGFSQTSATTLMMIYFTAAVFGAPLFAWLADRFGYAQSLQLGSWAFALFQGAFFIVPWGSFWMAATLTVGTGLCVTIALFLPRAMMSSIAEAEHEKTGQRWAGLLYAMLNGAMKIGVGLSVGIAFGALGVLEFEPNLPGSSSGLSGLRAIYSIVPAALFMGAAISVKNWGWHCQRVMSDERGRPG